MNPAPVSGPRKHTALATAIFSISLTGGIPSLASAQSQSGETVQPGVQTETFAIEASPQPHRLQAIEILGYGEDTTFSNYSFSTTKTETDILSTPQSISTITKETIGDQNLRRLNDIAPYVAGVNEFSVNDDLTIRGFRSTDDRRVNGLRAYNNVWSQSSIAHLERVEVIKGPAAATFGDASPGGVINMVTKKPLKETQREAQVSFGNHDHKYGAIDLTGPLNDNKSVLYRLNLAVEDSGSFRDEVFNETTTVAPSFSFLPSDGTRINLDLVYTDAKSVLDRGQPNVQNGNSLGVVPIEVSITQPGDKLDTTDISAALSIEQELTHDWSLVASHLAYYYDEKLQEHRTTNTYLSETEIELRYNDRDSEATVHNSSIYLTGTFTTGAIDHRLVIGADHTEKDDEQVTRTARGIGTFDVLNPVNVHRDVASYDLQEADWAPWETSLSTTGAYLHNQMYLGDWEVLAGLRYDSFESFTRSAGDTSPRDSDSQISPRFGVVYNLSNTQSIYGSWLTGFEPVTGFTENNGGPFDPSDSELFELGYKQRAFNEQLLFTASIYELTKNNIVVDANNPGNPDLQRQRGQERARGAELEANGRVTDKLSIIANYSYNDAEVTKDSDPNAIGKTKENAPRHAATLWGRYQLSHGFGLGLGATYVSERETFEPDLQLPSYTIFNAAIYYERDNLQVGLHGKNLTDKTHWTGGYNFGRVFPGDPRTVLLSAKLRF